MGTLRERLQKGRLQRRYSFSNLGRSYITISRDVSIFLLFTLFKVYVCVCGGGVDGCAWLYVCACVCA